MSGSVNFKSSVEDLLRKCNFVEEYELEISKTSVPCRGSYGTVYKGVHKKCGEGVAVKVMTKSSITARQWRNICHEVAILQSCRHPHIVEYHDACYDDKNIYIVTEWMEMDLFEAIEKKLIKTEVHAASIFKQLVSALDYLHAGSIVHRDIKPDNIVCSMASPTSVEALSAQAGAAHAERLDGDSAGCAEVVGGGCPLVVKLIDFGHAKWFGEQAAIDQALKTADAVAEMRGYAAAVDAAASVPGSPVEPHVGSEASHCVKSLLPSSRVCITPETGTLLYSAPEILSGLIAGRAKPRVTTRVDIPKLDMFSCGVVLYAIVFGVSPFVNPAKGRPYIASDFQQVQDQQYRGDWRRRRAYATTSVSEGVKELVEALLHPKASNRPTAREVLHDVWLIATAEPPCMRLGGLPVEDGGSNVPPLPMLLSTSSRLCAGAMREGRPSTGGGSLVEPRGVLPPRLDNACVDPITTPTADDATSLVSPLPALARMSALSSDKSLTDPVLSLRATLCGEVDDVIACERAAFREGAPASSMARVPELATEDATLVGPAMLCVDVVAI